MDVPQKLGAYELIRPIASGGMATVHLARRTGPFGFQRLVAIKLLHPDLSSNEEVVSMFLDEARIAAAIHHPNVVGVVEIDACEQGYFLVMELVDGLSLHALRTALRREGRTLPPGVALRIVRDALRGLHAAHVLLTADGKPARLVHRDATPQNVLVGVDGISRITDFGVATARARLASTRAGTLKGKLAYMAPEQVEERPLDKRVDVFAMGAVLWELWAGRRLFHASSDAETLRRVVSLEPPRLADEGVHPALDEVVRRALARRRSDRFDSAEQFADALERAAQTASLALASTAEVGELVKAARARSDGAPSRPISGLTPPSVTRPDSPQSMPATPPASVSHSQSIGSLGPLTSPPSAQLSARESTAKSRGLGWVAVGLLALGALVATGNALRTNSVMPMVDAAPPGQAASPEREARVAETAHLPPSAEPSTHAPVLIEGSNAPMPASPSAKATAQQAPSVATSSTPARRPAPPAAPTSPRTEAIDLSNPYR